MMGFRCSFQHCIELVEFYRMPEIRLKVRKIRADTLVLVFSSFGAFAFVGLLSRLFVVVTDPLGRFSFCLHWY
jgi:hypothetical protein